MESRSVENATVAPDKLAWLCSSGRAILVGAAEPSPLDCRGLGLEVIVAWGSNMDFVDHLLYIGLAIPC